MELNMTFEAIKGRILLSFLLLTNPISCMELVFQPVRVAPFSPKFYIV